MLTGDPGLKTTFSGARGSLLGKARGRTRFPAAAQLRSPAAKALPRRAAPISYRRSSRVLCHATPDLRRRPGPAIATCLFALPRRAAPSLSRSTLVDELSSAAPPPLRRRSNSCCCLGAIVEEGSEVGLFSKLLLFR